MKAALAIVTLLGIAACRDDDRPLRAPAKSAASVASIALAPGPRLQVRQRSRVSGLHVQSGSVTTAHGTWGFTDLGVDAKRIELQIVVAKGGAPLAKLLPDDALAVINGGYFEADFRPSTWVVRAGVELAPKSDTSKGGVLTVKRGQVYIGPFRALDDQPDVAIQSFPLIIEVDGRAGIHRDDGRRAARTVACLVGGELHFIVIAAPRGEGPTLLESMELLREPWPAGFGCRVALNLDGGPSSGVWFSSRVDAKQRPPVAPVAYGVALSPRT